MLRVPLSVLLVQDDEPPMYLPAVEALVDGTRIDERPIDVELIGLPLYRIRNGRHRFLAAVIRGDHDIAVHVLRRDPIV